MTVDDRLEMVRLRNEIEQAMLELPGGGTFGDYWGHVSARRVDVWTLQDELRRVASGYFFGEGAALLAARVIMTRYEGRLGLVRLYRPDWVRRLSGGCKMQELFRADEWRKEHV